jgi:hypothetical protein
MVEGSFRGVKTHPEVKKPAFTLEGSYETVRYGWLDYFSLYVPVGSTVKRADKGNITYYIVVTPEGCYGFKVSHGSAEYPAVGNTLTDEETARILKEIEIVDEAKAVF